MLRCLLALLALATPAFAQDPVTVTPVTTETRAADGDPILLPQGPAQVAASLFEIAPGARLPVHKHPYPRLAYVLDGTLVVTAEDTGEETSYAPGDVVVEMVDDWHWGRNDGDAPVRLLVIDLAPEGASNTILHD
jgi:quercetin dioxygenase-like cupin family protein